MTSSDDTAPAPRSLWSGVWPWLAAILSGALLVVCFPRFDQGGVVWFALVPVICATWFRGESRARARWRRALHGLGPGYLTGLVFFTSTFHWLSTLAPLFEAPLLVAIPFLLALLFGFYIGLWTWLLEWLVPRGDARRFPNSWRNLATGALGASAWVVLEWTRGWLFGGFGWNGLGVALHRDLAMIQIAEFTGVWGLTWLVAFVNLMIVIVVRRVLGELGPAFLRRVRWEFSITVALVVAVFGFGVRQLFNPDRGPSQPLRVAAIQPNIPQREKFDPRTEQSVLATLERLTTLALVANPPPQLLVWPEACTPRPLFADENTYNFVLRLAQREGFGLLLGTLDFDPTLDEDYNIAALFTDSGVEQQLYRKMHLVPFGEYLPLRPIFGPIAGAIVPGDMTPGREVKVLRLRDPAISLAALVCFEDTVGDLTRRFVASGAQLLVNITNDGWFATSPGAEQHLANAVFRTIETRRPLLRCGNTGLTGSIDAYGRSARFDRSPRDVVPRDVVPFLRPFEEGFVAGKIAVPTSNRLTFYTRHGDWLPQLCLVLTAYGIVRSLLRLRQRTKQ